MRFLQGLLLGVAVGCVVAAAADVYRPYAIGVGIVSFALSLVLAGRETARVRTPAVPGPARPAAAVAPVPSAPGGFFAGRRLGDALAWLAQERGISTLEQVAVAEELVAVTDVGPHGRRFTVVSAEGGGFRADSTDAPAEAGAGLDTSARFQARDLAPDVLARALERARREHPDTWAHVRDPEAVVDRPDRLRDEVTVRLTNSAPQAGDETLWVSAAGDLLYLQRALA